MILKILGVLLAIILIVVIASAIFMVTAPQFGATPKGESLNRILASENQIDGKFVNLIDTVLDTRKPGESMEIMSYLFPDENKNPSVAIQSVQFDYTAMQPGDFVWFGHSTVLLKTSELNIIADPVFYRASPIPIGGKPFAMTETPTTASLPALDVVIISHDHYDHLDHKAIQEIEARTERFLVPLGIGSHLLRWGVPADKITELDWYDSVQHGDTQFTLTPSRHFSGRGLTNRNTTLWASWVVKTDSHSVFFSGDSGYFKEFNVIGSRFGPFDIAFIENGAYDSGWSQIHMMPEESAQAAVDLNSTLFFPIHWGKFDLAKHQWTDPIIRAEAAAKKLKLTLVAPKVGQIFKLASPPFEPWWRQ